MIEVRLNGAKPIVINETPGICGGFPRIDNTLIRVALVVEAVRELGGVDKAWKRGYRDILTRSEFRGAYKFYQQNPARVDEDISRDKDIDIRGGIVFSVSPQA